jgi:hypothetical protein
MAPIRTNAIVYYSLGSRLNATESKPPSPRLMHKMINTQFNWVYLGLFWALFAHILNKERINYDTRITLRNEILGLYLKESCLSLIV